MNCKQGLIALVLGVLVSVATARTSQAEFVTVMRTNTDDIVVPRFDTNLGTLNSVSLTVTLLNDSTLFSGSHSHNSVTVSSTQIFSSAPIGFNLLGSPVAVGFEEDHAITTPSYSGDGLTVGEFNLTAVGSQGHTHALSISHTTPLLLGLSGNWRARVVVSTSNASIHSHAYGSQTKNLLLSGGDLTPFTTGVGDITISAGTASTALAGTHSHSIDFGGSVQIGPSSFVSTNFSGTLPPSGAHVHSYDPRFSVSATFDYSPVPEPGSGALMAAAAIGLIGTALAVRRRRQLFTD